MLELIRKKFGWLAKEPAPSDGAVARVSLGAGLLDAARPDWWMLVRPEEVDLLSSTKCVLGQVFGKFSKGLDAVKFPKPSDNLLSYGFCPKEQTTETIDVDEADLRRAWKLAVESRRAAAGVR